MSLVNAELLRQTCEALEDQSSKAADVAQLLLTIYKTEPMSHIPDQLYVIFQDDIYMCFESVHVLLPELHRLDPDKARQMVTDSQIIKNALQEAIDNRQDYAVKLKCTVLLMEIWLLFPSLVTPEAKGHRNQSLS